MNQAILDALKQRRSIRSFTGEQVSREALDIVLEAGTYAPSAMGSQSAKIVAVQDPATVKQLHAMNAAIMGSDASETYYNAPTIILVFGPSYAGSYVEDATLVLGNMLLAAYGLGLGGCWIHREKEMFETPEGKELMRKWRLSEDFVGVGGMALGHIKGEAPVAARRKDDYIIRI